MNSSKMKDIADKLRLSVSTISRVVNQRPYVSEDTRQKVLSALEEYNYIPNEIARSLKTQASSTIGVIVPDIGQILFSQIIKGIDEVVSKHGYTIVVADTNENKENEEKYLDVLYQKRVDALALATVMPKGRKIMQYYHGNIPVVFIDNLPQFDEGVDAVLLDNVKASRIAVSHLLKLGHRDIAVIIGSLEETTGYERLAGYRAALVDAGVQINEELIQYGNYKEETGFARMQVLINNRNKSPFTAVYVTSEMMTYGAIKAILHNKLRIPDDISLVGFDVYDKTGLIFPSITTIRQSENRIGRQVGELLLKRLGQKNNLDEDKDFKQKVLLAPYLEENQSCRLLFDPRR